MLHHEGAAGGFGCLDASELHMMFCSSFRYCSFYDMIMTCFISGAESAAALTDGFSAMSLGSQEPRLPAGGRFTVRSLRK